VTDAFPQAGAHAYGPCYFPSRGGHVADTVIGSQIEGDEGYGASLLKVFWDIISRKQRVRQFPRRRGQLGEEGAGEISA